MIKFSEAFFIWYQTYNDYADEIKNDRLQNTCSAMLRETCLKIKEICREFKLKQWKIIDRENRVF